MQEASNPAKVKVYGPAIEPGVKTFQPTHFIVDCSEAGPGKPGSRRFSIKFIFWLKIKNRMLNFDFYKN